MYEPNEHPSLDDLALWALHPDADPEHAIALHAAGCADCARRVHDLKRLAVTASSAAAAQPPESVMERARDLLGRTEPLVLVAELIEDTRELAGVRGTGDARFLLFRAGEFEIDVRMEESGDLRGQIHGPPSSRLRQVDVHALRGAHTVGTGLTDEHGEFRLARITPPFFLRFVGESIRVRTPDVMPFA